MVTKEIQNRRSIRRYKTTEISKDIIEEIINAARLAPSGKNKQPWKFIVYREKKNVSCWIRCKYALACKRAGRWNPVDCKYQSHS